MLSFSFSLTIFSVIFFSTPPGHIKTKKVLHTLQARTGWWGGWDSNPRRPSPQGPKPRAGYDPAFCPLHPALGPPQISPALATPRRWAHNDYIAAHLDTLTRPAPSYETGSSP